MHHSTEAVKALERIVESIQREEKLHRKTVCKLLNHIHSVYQIYRALAFYLASVEEFPERATRWPGFFGCGETDAGESEGDERE
jgi:hypothetical protein